MKRLPLYPKPPTSIFDEVRPRPLDSECQACVLHSRTKTVCMRPDGEAGGLYVIGTYPGKYEESYGGTGRPWVGPAHGHVRREIAKWWTGPVVYDYAVRCAPGSAPVKSKQVDACRPYTSRVLFDTSPTRILCFGLEASESVLGRRVSAVFARRGFGWHHDEEGNAIPVFFILNPTMATRNKFLQRQMDDDIRWAIETPIPDTLYRGVTMLVESAHDAEVAEEALSGADVLVYDVESYGRPFNRDFRISTLTLLDFDEDAISWTWSREAMRDAGARAPLQRLLASKKIRTAGQNVKYDDLCVMADLGIVVPTTELDTRLIRKLEDSFADASLDTLAEGVGLGGHKAEADEALDKVVAELNRLAFPPKRDRAPIVDIDVPDEVVERIRNGVEPKAYAYDFLPTGVLYRYNARDVWSTREVMRSQVSTMPPHVSRVWREVTRDASVAVRHIEAWGIACERAHVEHLATYCRIRIDEAMGTIRSIAGNDFNPASPKQLESLLFDKLKLPSGKTTDSGSRSTDKDVLAKLRGRHPIVDALLEFRRYEKLNGTYAHGMMPHIRDDGRIHPSFLLDGTDTGRLSCRDPNLQNIPRAKGDEDAKFARNCFVAAPGYKLLELDFSQIELRVAALLSGDRAMTDDFIQGIDIHRKNARACCRVAWGMSTDQWDAMTKDQQDPYRSKIKTATFGRLYGKHPRALAKEWGVDVKEVEAIDKTIWGRYHRLDAWTKECVKEAKRTGVAWTYWGGEPALCRPIPKIADPDEGMRQHAERTSFNTPVQGTAALYTNASLWPIVSWIRRERVPAKLVLTVHDSIMLEVRDDLVHEAAGKCREVMRSHYSGDVPLEVEAKYGEAWGELDDLKFS